MDHISDYAKWMADIPFGGDLTDPDAMILCYLTYADLSPILGPGDEMPLREAVKRMDEHKEIPCLILGGDPHYSERVRMIASTRRFGDLIVAGYTDEIDRERNLQFCAMVFRSEKWSFMAFRGTDQTLVGWKEDFIMSFTVMPSQTRAAEYLKERIGDGKWYLGGHSKGGNLALYAACTLGDRLAQVGRVYLLDSPGLCREALEDTGVDPDAAYDRLVRIIPEYDVVGGLFAPKAPREIIVSSDAQGLMQHDMATWGVDHGRLLEASGQDPMSVLLVDAVGNWLAGVDRQGREEFVEDLFSQLERGGKKYLGDVTAEGILGYESIVIGLVRKRGGRQSTGKLPLKANLTRMLSRVTGKLGALSGMWEGIAQCAALMVLGLLCLVVNEHLMETLAGITLSAIAAVQDVWTLRRLIRERKNMKEQTPYVMLSLFVTVLVLCMLFREDAAFLLGSIGVSIGLFAMGYHCVRLFLGRTRKGFYRWIRLPESLILFLFGIVYLVVPRGEASTPSAVLGVVMMADGAIRLCYILLSTAFGK